MDHTAAMTVRSPSAREAGFSLLEVTIASVMVLMLAWLVATLSIDGMRAQKYSERQARVTEITQDVVDDMQRSLGSAVGMFGGGALGEGYRAALVLGTLPNPIASSRIPTVDVSGRLEREGTSGTRTGNELFFARYGWTDEFEVGSGRVYRVDVYRIERFYLTRASVGPRQGAPDGLNMAHWVSEPLADGHQIDRITDTNDLQDLLEHLLTRSPDVAGVVHDAVKLVWMGHVPIADPGTFREIDPSGSLSATPLGPRGASWRIFSELRLCDPDMLVYRHHSIATNFALGSMGVGRFAPIQATNGGFPHGFEVQIVGPPSARQVLIHLTIVSTNRDGRRASADMQTIVDVRDP